MGLKVSVHGASGAHTIKKIVEERAGFLSIKREIDGADDLLKVDLTNIPAGLHYPGSHTDSFETLVGDNLYGIRRLTHETPNINVNIAGQLTGTPKPEHDDADYYAGPYPRYIFVGAGETVSLDTGAGTAPAWVPTQTTQQRDAKIRIEKANGWERTLHALAVAFDTTDFSLKWAAQEAKYRQGEPEIGISLRKRIAREVIAVSKIDNVSVHLCQLLGLAFRAVRLYRSMSNAKAFDLSNITVWAAGEIAQGDYRRHNNKTWIAISAHTATDSNAPGTAGGNAVWKQTLLDGVPSTVNVTTGAGIEALVTTVKSHFDLGARKLFRLAGQHETFWSSKAVGKQISTMNLTTGAGDALLYNATISAHNPRDNVQPAVAGFHSDENWYELFERFIEALDYVEVLEPHELRNQSVPPYAAFHHNMMLGAHPLP